MGKFDDHVIESATYTYMRSLSIYNTIDIMNTWTNQKKAITKKVLLKHMETLIDTIPLMHEVTAIFKPERSGYYAWDGTWLKYLGENIVLLICFDVETLDLIDYHWDADENYESYSKLIEKIETKQTGALEQAKGFFMDGELSLMKHLREKYPDTPKQLCAFHRYARLGQIIPFKRAKGMDKEIKIRVEKVIFAESKEEAICELQNLKDYASQFEKNAKLHKAIGVLKRNFDLLLTHFDNPKMSPYNNVLEGFNHIIKRRLRLMKGFKKEMNIDRWLKLMLLDYRFHIIKSSKFKERNGKSPLQLAKANIPDHINWINMIRNISS